MSERNKIVTSTNLIPMCVLRILEDHSDAEHKLTQKDIIHYLQTEYSVGDIDRKSISRALSRLQEEMEIDIEADGKKGVWLSSRLFEDYELHMLIDSVFTCKYIPKKYSKDIINKLASLGNEFFNSHIKYTYSTDNLGKTENLSVFSNIEVIDAAIEKSRQVEFDYNKYGPDKKLHKTFRHRATCYRVLAHNGRLYLKGLSEKHGNIFYYRLDHITDMVILEDSIATPIRKVPGYENGLSNEKLASNLPYLYTDPQKTITFWTSAKAIDQVVDWFGVDSGLKCVEKTDERCKFSITTSPTAFQYFAQQYYEEIEVLQPQDLREKLYKIALDAVAKYSSSK